MTEERVKIRMKFHVATGRTGHKEVRDGDAPQRPSVTEGHIPRISRLMALAIRFEQLICDGVVQDQADLARLALVSRARVTQIMDLLMLAPDILEALLFLPPVHNGRYPVTEHHVRSVLKELDWHNQHLRLTRFDTRPGSCREQSAASDIGRFHWKRRALLPPDQIATID